MSGALTSARGPRAGPARAWQLRLLGRPELVAADGLRSIALRPKDAALLALVALAGPIQSDHVAALLWPSATGKQADTSLRQRLFRLRRETGMALISSGASMTLEPGLDHDLAATLAQIALDEHAGRAELLGDLDFDDLPDLAAWVGAEVAAWVGAETMRWILGATFIVMAGWCLIPDKAEDGPQAARKAGAFLATLVAFFIVEIGDKTQIATVALAAKYNALVAVVAGTTLGMMIANIPAVLLGEVAAKKLNMRVVHAVAATIFLVMGVIILIGWGKAG